MTFETILTMLLYVAAGWIALLGLASLKTWRRTHEHVALATGLLDVVASTVGIAYLVWWPLLIAVTWLWIVPFMPRSPSD